MNRLFVNEPVWTPYNRPGADNLDCRKDYLTKLQSGTFNGVV